MIINKKGFTLIEMLIALTIISILYLIAINLFDFKEKVELNSIKTNINSTEKELAGLLLAEEDNLFTDEYFLDNYSKIYSAEGEIERQPEKALYNISSVVDSKELFLSDNDGKIYYVKESVVETEDFKWVKDPKGYNFGSYPKGYWKYTGEEKEVVVPNSIEGIKLNNYYRMFEDSEVTKVSSNNKEVQSFERMFHKTKTNSLNLKNLDFSNVHSVNKMFLGAEVDYIDLKNVNMNNVVEAKKMFAYLKTKALDLSNVEMNNIEVVYQMFSGMKAKEVNLSSLKMPKVKDLTSFFSLAQIDSLLLNDFNTENIAVMKTMFWGSEIDLVDLRSFNVNNLTDGIEMFNGLKSKAIYVSSEKIAKKLNEFSTSKPTEVPFTIKA